MARVAGASVAASTTSCCRSCAARASSNVYAGITLPNPASVALHEGIGMRRIGVYERVGFKLGEWHDVAWYGLRLADPDGVPPEPTPLPELGP